LLPPREACRRLGIHLVTLKRWIYSGKIRAVRTPTGRWMIPESEVERIIGGKEEVKEVRAIIYARVSSSDQKSDLERQIEYLTQYCTAKGYRESWEKRNWYSTLIQIIKEYEGVRKTLYNNTIDKTSVFLYTNTRIKEIKHYIKWKKK